MQYSSSDELDQGRWSEKPNHMTAQVLSSDTDTDACASEDAPGITPWSMHELAARTETDRQCVVTSKSKDSFPRKKQRAKIPPLLQNRTLFQSICPGCLWVRDNMWLLSRVQRLAGPAGDRGLLSRLEVPTQTKCPSFVPVGGSTRDKKSQLFYPGW